MPPSLTIRQEVDHASASLGLIAATAALVLGLVAATLSIVAISRNHDQTVTLNPSTAPDKRTISVSGTGIATLAPDLARFNVGVQEQGTNLTEVQGTVARETDTIFNALVKAGLDKDKDLKTSGYSVQPIYDYPKDKAPVVSGYRVANTVNATVRGARHEPEQGRPDHRRRRAGGRDEHRQYHLHALRPGDGGQGRARCGDEERAGEGGCARPGGRRKLGMVITVSDQSVTPAPPRDVPARGRRPAAGAAAPPTQIQPGETTVTVMVNVTYALQ